MLALNKSQNEKVTQPINSKVKKINDLLNSTKTRVSGLELLNSFLDNCSDKELTDYCVNWMQNCCKIDSSEKNRELGIHVLKNLFTVSADIPELKKTVSFFITTRFFDYFFKYFLDSEAGWSCAKSCFWFYKGACGTFQVPLKNHLTNQLEKDLKISYAAAECYALIPCLGGGGHENINYVKNWSTQFLKFVDFCHCVLNKLFANIEELQEYDTQESVFNKEDDDLSTNYLVNRLFNYCSVLKFMLLNKYPVQKCISLELILQMICRGLAVNSNTIGKSQTAEIIALQKVLPEIHIILHSLLNAVIATCRSQLLPYSHLMCKLIKQTLKWTESYDTSENNKQLASLRVSVYEVLCNWLVATKSGSCVETISKIVIPSALNDIQTKKTVTLLKESKQSNFGENKGKTKVQNKEKVERVNPSSNSSVCFAALKALQFLLKFLGTSLTAEEHTILQEVTIRLLSDIQNSSTNMVVPYSDTACRKELYALLLELVNRSCNDRPPPTSFALRIFARGQNDSSFIVANLCSTALNQITNVIHSPFDSPGILGSSQNESYTHNRTEETRNRDESMEKENVENDPNIASILNEVSVEKNVNEAVEKSTPNQKSKIMNPSEESDVSSHEDSIITVQYPKSDADVEITKNEAESEGKEKEVEVEDQRADDLSTINDEPVPKKFKNDTEGSISEPNSTVDIKNKTPSPEKSKKAKKSSPTVMEESYKESKRSNESQEDLLKTNKDQVKVPELKILEDNCSIKSYSPESSNDESKVRDPRKRYFLRSKTSKENLEEEEVYKDTGSSEGIRTPTPTRTSHRHSLTPFSTKQRPRTRALSKLETIEDENDSKKDEDDDENIIEVFDDSYVE